SGINGPELEGDFKCRGCLLTENVQHLRRGQWLRFSCPAKFSALPTAKLALALRSDEHHLRFLLGGNFAGSDQPIAFADEQIPHIQSHWHAMFFMKRLLAVTQRIVIFNIVVNE